jgi:homoserine/homoserine lactone efflux protein
MTFATWLAFFIATLILCISPGPGALSSISSGMRHGWSRGMWNVVGMQAATIVNITVIALGLGAILIASTTAFEILKWAGVAYLVWLGIQKWREPPIPFDDQAAAKADHSDGTPKSIFRQGFFVNLTNPKGLIFLLAVLPQFIDPNQPQAMQYVILTATMVGIDFAVMAGYTGLAARVLRLLKDPSHIRWTNRFLGGLFVGAGAALAAFKRT